MPAYHTQFNNEGEFGTLGNMALIPIKTKIRGPSPPFHLSPNDEDIIDETISLYRANCFFKNFEIKGPGDKVLIYLTLFISECLQKLQQKMPNMAEGQRLLSGHAVGNFALPGDAGFPLNALFEKPNRLDAENLRQYLSQLRQEMAIRLPLRVYCDGQDKPSKWWMCFSKKKFMGMNGVSGGA